MKQSDYDGNNRKYEAWLKERENAFERETKDSVKIRFHSSNERGKARMPLKENRIALLRAGFLATVLAERVLVEAERPDFILRRPGIRESRKMRYLRKTKSLARRVRIFLATEKLVHAELEAEEKIFALAARVDRSADPTPSLAERLSFIFPRGLSAKDRFVLILGAIAGAVGMLGVGLKALGF
jgi:hypothetical protein